MRKSVLIVILSLISLNSFGQSFKDALRAYENGDYTTALELFTPLTDQQGLLFRGKALFNLNRLNESRLVLLKSTNGANTTLKADAYYTLAQINIIDNFPAKALDYLYLISHLENVTGTVKSDASRLFNSYNSFLNFSQRLKAIHSSSHSSVIASIITEGIRVESKENASSLVILGRDLAKSGLLSNDDINLISTAFINKTYSETTLFPKSPEGMTYTIGVLLPNDDKKSENFVVSKSLYQGIQTAVEEFNASNRLNRVFLTHYSVPDTSNIVANVTFKESAHVIIGPLTSNGAKSLVSYAEEFGVPMLAPLANNDSLNIDNPYFFQINPAFRTRGKKMAEFALSRFNIDTVAIMVEKNSMGYLSALAFKEEMERKNVYVAYFFAGNFEATGFDIAEYTQYFTSDQVLRDSLGIPTIDAVYFPYTGPQSETLIDLTLTDLEAGRSTIPILGSQDWGYIEITPERLRRFQIYFPDAVIVDEKNERVIQFRQNYQDITKGSEVDYFSILGYDIGTYVLEVIRDFQNPASFKYGIKHKPLFKGIGNEIYFNGTHVNQSLTIYKMDKDGIVKVSK